MHEHAKVFLFSNLFFILGVMQLSNTTRDNAQEQETTTMKQNAIMQTYQC
jgi:hypothetical protein